MTDDPRVPTADLDGHTATALCGEDDDFFLDTRTWVDDPPPDRRCDDVDTEGVRP